MEHALFLEKPIRGNPRQRVQAQQGSRLPVTPSDTVSPPPSQHIHSPLPVPESDDLLTSATEQSAGRHMTTIPCMTQAQWQSPDMDILATPSPSDQTDLEEPSTKAASRHARKNSKSGMRKPTKAACSACRKRKSKVRHKHTHLKPFVSLDPLYPSATNILSTPFIEADLLFFGLSSVTANVRHVQAASPRINRASTWPRKLEGYATVLRLLQNAHPEDCDRIIRDLRRPKSLAGGVKTVLEKWMLETVMDS
ncbi:hypothetical protein E4T50_12625 [Aureobasidium sp. EXF-12298]|nr:hypothetical protein E4T50_12625 [Aureobasidium sp. EXF-12298]KAI4756763.1 hypothetical protein E4T51_10158 [Aureobasidium sp. EXF-12344]